MFFIKHLITRINPDIIFNCQIELTSAIRSVLELMKIKRIPIISYCHYPALWDESIKRSKAPLIDMSLNNGGVGYSIMFNILTAVITANKVLIQSHYARNLLENAISFYKIPYKHRIEILPPPIDTLLFDNKNHYNSNIHYTSFLYNHRLYNSYGTEEFLKTSQKIIQKYKLKSVVFDSMPNRSSERTILNGSPEYYKTIILSRPNTLLFNGHVSRKVYKSNILNNLFAMGAFRKTCVWSMAALDCMCLGVPVIAPNYASYPEFIPKQLLFSNEVDMLQVVNKLVYDTAFRKDSSYKCYTEAKKYEVSKICDKLLKIFEKEKEKACVE